MTSGACVTRQLSCKQPVCGHQLLRPATKVHKSRSRPPLSELVASSNISAVASPPTEAVSKPPHGMVSATNGTHTESKDAGMSVAIVGAGFSGICMAIQLKKAGFHNFTIYEAAEDIGGTWRQNTYPGCACDIPSVLYCYSFEPYPWTEHFSSQPEILKYLHHCVDKYGLWAHIKLNTRVNEADFDVSSGTWTVATDDAKRSIYRVFVMAQGALNLPRIPDVPGLSSFPGTTFHSAAWDSSCELRGKRVAVVGTGASAIQIIPELQPLVEELVVFQRTPPWVLARQSRIPGWMIEAEHASSWFAWFQRIYHFTLNELILGRAATTNNQTTLGMIEKMGLSNLHKYVKEPELRQKLTPTYSLGCKRVLGSDDYYPALTAPNARVITSGLREIKGNTIVAEDGSEADVDVIIFATGFDLPATLKQIDITGLNNANLLKFDQDPEAFYGLSIHGFPNLFTICGANTGLGHNSLVYMIECGVNAIVQLVKRIDSKQLLWITPNREAQDRYNAEVQQRLKSTVWLAGGCKSWYLDRKATEWGDKAGSSILWPGLCLEYYRRTAWWSPRDWDTAAAPVSAEGEKAKLL